MTLKGEGNKDPFGFVNFGAKDAWGYEAVLEETP